MTSEAMYERRRRGDPFYDPPLHKAYYHPSRQKKLSDEKRLTALSVEEMQYPPDVHDLHFMKVTNTYQQDLVTTGASPKDTSSKFDETWPETEKASTLNSPREGETTVGGKSPMRPLNDMIQKLLTSERTGGKTGRERTTYDALSDIVKDRDSTGLTQNTTKGEKSTQRGESTLSKYIERFRYGAPMSRQDRLKTKSTDPSDFWWIGGEDGGQAGGEGPTPKDSSTPRDESSTSSGSKVRSRLQRSPRSAFTTTTSSSDRDSKLTSRKLSSVDLDSDTQRFIEKTDQILEKSESSLNSSDPVVSTVGLGSSSSSSSQFTSSFRSARDRPYTYRPSGVEGGREDQAPATRRARRAEDDILYQWRAQRRAEVMRNKANMRLQTGQAYTSTRAQVSDLTDHRIAEIKRRVGAGEAYRRDPLQDPAAQPTAEHQPTNRPDSQHKQVQSDAVCQTSPRVSQDADVTSVQNDVRKEHHSPIASPALRRRNVTQQNDDVNAHYHLSCDIIPCPHPHPHPHPHPQKHRSYHSDTDTDESRPRPYDDVIPVKDVGPLVLDSGTESEFEGQRQRGPREGHAMSQNDHQKLGQRLPEGLKVKDQGQKVKDKGQKAKEGQKQHKATRESVESSDESTLQGDEFGEDEKMKKSREKEQNVPHAKKDSINKEGREEKARAETKETFKIPSPRFKKKRLVPKKKLDDSRGRNREEREEEGRGGEKKGKDQGKKRVTASKPRPTWSNVGQPGVRGQARSGDVMTTSSEMSSRRSSDSCVDVSVQESTPLCHSSPIHRQRAVTPTIHKVVTERLFEASSDEDEAPVGTRQDEGSRDIPDDKDEPLLSDGEDFSEDGLLSELRARRLHYLLRLEEIDRLLDLH